MYDFRQLSPADFEELTRDLLQAEWGLRLETFRTGRDGGIDLRCSSTEDGQTVVQCKHYVGTGLAGLLRTLRSEEATKVVRLAPGRYVLVTSVPLSPGNKAEIRSALHPFVRADGDVIGAEDLNNLLRRHPDVERSNFKLWLSSTAVLQRVLHNAELTQADFQVERVRRRLPLYVPTSAYPKALDILAREHVVVISGVPGVGKTTLADLLLFAHLEQGYAPVVVRSEISEARRLFDRERRQIFYYDDFLGQTFLDTRSDFVGRREDGAILDFVDMVARSTSAKFVLTTREHLLRHAFWVSEPFERERATLADRQCVLDVGEYSLLVRARILYNHIYFSDLPTGHREQLLAEAFYLTILRHRNFNPRLIEWLSNTRNLRDVPAEEYRRLVLRTLESPAQLWRVAFEHQISQAARSVLLALYGLGGHSDLVALRTAWEPLHRRRAQRHNFTTAPEDWRASLQELENAFVVLPNLTATFVNPSVKDFLDELLCDHIEYTEDVLAAARRFQTVATLWKLAASVKGNELLGHLSRRPGMLVEALRHVLHPTPPSVVGDSADGSVTPPCEQRLAVVVQMSLSLPGARLDELALGLVEEVDLEWAEREPDFRTLVSVLSELENRDEAVGQGGSDMQAGIKARMLAAVRAKPRHFSTFLELAQYADVEDSFMSRSERESLVGPFTLFLATSFEDHLSDTDRGSELEELGGDLQVVGDWLGVSVDEQQQLVSDKLEELQERAQAEARDVGYRPSAVGSGPVEDEQEVRRLFDGLAQ